MHTDDEAGAARRSRRFAALEEPTSDEPAMRIDIGPAPVVIAGHFMDRLNLTG